MKKLLVAVSLMATCAVAQAQLTGNVGMTSDYRGLQGSGLALVAQEALDRFAVSGAHASAAADALQGSSRGAAAAMAATGAGADRRGAAAPCFSLSRSAVTNPSNVAEQVNTQPRG